MLKKLETACSRIPLWAWCALIFCVAVGARVYWLEKKETLHLDETLSLELAFYRPKNPGFEDAQKNGGVSRVYTGKELKEISLSCDPSLGAAVDTVKKLRDNNRDAPHTNFYYSLLRLWWIGNDGKTSFSSLKWHGCALNFVFFAGTFLALVALLKRLFGKENKAAVCAGLVAGTFCTAAISDTIFMRPYALQEPFFVLFTLGAVVLIEKLRGNVPIVTPKNLFVYAFLTALTLLTAYFSVAYVILIFALLAIFAWRGNERRSVPFLGAIFVGAVAIASVIYPDYLNGFFCYRGKEAAGKFALETLGSNLSSSFKAVAASLCDGLFYVPVIALLIAFGAWRYFFDTRERDGDGNANAAENGTPTRDALKDRLPLILVGIALAWSCACMFLAPYKTLRYIMPMASILALLIPWVALKCRGWKRTVFIAGTIVSYAVCAWTAKGTWAIGTKKYLASPISQVEQIFPGYKKAVKKYPSQNALFVAAPGRAWNISDMLVRLRDQDKIRFALDDGKTNIGDAIKSGDSRTLWCEQVSCEKNPALLQNTEAYRLVRKQKISRFTVFDIQKTASTENAPTKP